MADEKCVLCSGSGKMPEVSREERLARDAKVDAIAEEAIKRILFRIPQDPDDPAPQSSLAQRSDAETLRDLLVEEIGDMLGEMTIAQAGLKRIDGSET